MTTRFGFAALAAVVALAGATQALAHAKLVSSTPAADAKGAAPHEIALRFSEKLQPKLSGFDVTAGSAKVPLKVSVSKDGMSLTGVPAKHLVAGAYHVEWHAVTDDSHRMTGSYNFTVQ